MFRAFKGVLKSVVPAGAKQWLKSKLYPSAASTSPFSIRLSERGIEVRLQDRTLLQAPSDIRGDVEAIFSDTQCCLEPLAIYEAGLKGNGVLFDIGAHVGVISILFAKAAPGNRAVAFEPSPALNLRAQELFKLNGVIEQASVEPCALGETPGRTTMLVDPVGGFVQIKRFEHSMHGAPREIDLEVETVDRMAARLSLRPTTLKIDVEGYELEVLKGAARVLSADRPVVFLELHLDYLEARGIQPSAVLEELFTRIWLQESARRSA